MAGITAVGMVLVFLALAAAVAWLPADNVEGER